MQINKTKILLADDNADFISILSQYLSSIDDFEITGIMNNGVDAFQAILQDTPDVVILDIVMPQLDGLGVLKRFNDTKAKKRPKFIIISSIGEDNIIQEAISLGATYYYLKPFNIDDMVLRIKQITRKKSVYLTNSSVINLTNAEDKNYEKKIREVLGNLEVPIHLKGYQYLMYAINIVLEDLTSINSVHKIIYSKVASAFHTTVSRVERSIRNAIEITWSTGNLKYIDLLFSDKEYKQTRPTNAEFIIKIVDTINNDK